MNGFALSGAAILVNEKNEGSGNAVPVLNWRHDPMGCLDPTRPNPRHGFCAIHIDEWDEGQAVGGRLETSNQYLVADVTYATEGKGGEFTVGLTRGTILGVGGVDVISIKAYFVSGVFGVPLVVSQPKRVQATITWPTSPSPCDAYISLPSIDLEAGVASDWFKIPRQAKSMIAQITDPTHQATLFADFAPTASVATLAFVTQNPVANGTVIDRGVEFVRFRGDAPNLITAVFEIYP